MKNWRTRHIDRPLGARIAELRTLRGLSRRDLATRLGVSVSSLQHHEDGDDRFSAAQIWQICGLLGVEVAEIFRDLPDRTVASPEDAAALADPSRAARRGVSEQSTPWVGPSPVREDVMALARAARGLAPEQVGMLTDMVRGMKRGAGDGAPGQTCGIAISQNLHDRDARRAHPRDQDQDRTRRRTENG